MKRANRAAFTAAALLSCTLTFSGCSLISQALPQQDGTAGEQAEADGQQPEGQQTTGENEASQDSDAGGGSSDSASSSSSEGTSTGAEGSDEGTADSGNGTTGTDAGQSSGSQAEVSIGESFEDPEMQDKIEVLSAVRNFDSSKKATSIELGGEVVLLEVKITPGQKYSGLIQSGAFKISDDGGADYRYDQTSGVEAEMKAAGYDPFEDVARRDGGTHQGWIAYVPDEKQDTYKIRYERGAGKVMGTDEKVPEFTTTFDIPST
jgi:hypothetical protein